MQIFSINWNERWSLVCVFFSFSFGYIYFFFAMVVVVFVFVIVVVYPYYLFLHFRFLQHFHYFCLEFVLDWVAASFSINNIQSRAHRYLCILYMNIYIYIYMCVRKSELLSVSLNEIAWLLSILKWVVRIRFRVWGVLKVNFRNRNKFSLVVHYENTRSYSIEFIRPKLFVEYNFHFEYSPPFRRERRSDGDSERLSSCSVWVSPLVRW